LVARKPTPDQPKLPFDLPEVVPDRAEVRPTTAPSAAGRVGRPRVWESEAERKSAYRERLARDLAEPQRLRRELRNARRRAADQARRLADAQRDLAHAEAEIGRRMRREIELEAAVERLEMRLEGWRSRAQELARAREADRQDPNPLGIVPAVPSASKVTPRPKRQKRGRR
jgi:hypothetical protein